MNSGILIDVPSINSRIPKLSTFIIALKNRKFYLKKEI